MPVLVSLILIVVRTVVPLDKMLAVAMMMFSMALVMLFLVTDVELVVRVLLMLMFSIVMTVIMVRYSSLVGLSLLV